MIEIRHSKSNSAECADKCRQPATLRNAEYSNNDLIINLSLLSLSSAVLFIARRLQPSPRGAGTHQQIGLPPCPFLHLTGLPCPSCGLTTSFAHAARLHFYEALVTQPFGLIIFCFTVLSIPLSIYFIRRRIAWSRLIWSRKTNLAMYAMITLYLLSWLYKIAVM